jgi:hypothetical protein
MLDGLVAGVDDQKTKAARPMPNFLNSMPSKHELD